MITTIKKFRLLYEKYNTESEEIQLLHLFEELSARVNYVQPLKNTGTYQHYLTTNFKQQLLHKFSTIGENLFHYHIDFFTQHPPEKYSQYYLSEWFTKYQLPMSLAGIQEYKYSRFEHILSAIGQQHFEAFLLQQLETRITENGLINALNTIDDEGLTVYRAITIPSHNIYDWLSSKYSGLGIYWSFEQKGAYPYNANSNDNYYIMQAKVRLQDINWKETIKKCLYSLRHELEIEINLNSIVKLEAVFSKQGSKHVPLKNPIYVSI